MVYLIKKRKGNSTKVSLDAPDERRKERDEAFSIRMIELSILATTLCGIMISFSYQNIPTVIITIALPIFLVSGSFFVSSGMGSMFLILLGKGVFAEKLPADAVRTLRNLSVLLFFGGMICFLFGMGFIVLPNLVSYILVFIPIYVMLIPIIYYLLKYRPRASKTK